MTIQESFINYINPNNIKIPAIKLNQSIDEYKTNIIHSNSQEFINNNINLDESKNNEEKISLILSLNNSFRNEYPEHYVSSTGLMFYNEILNYLNEENLEYQLDIINRINFKEECHLELAISSLIAKVNEKFGLSDDNKEIINEIIEKANYEENKFLSENSKKILQNELNNFSTKESYNEFSSEGSKSFFGEEEPKTEIDIKIENELNPVSKKVNYQRNC